MRYPLALALSASLLVAPAAAAQTSSLSSAEGSSASAGPVVGKPLLQVGADATQAQLTWYTRDLRVLNEHVEIAPSEQVQGETFPANAQRLDSSRRLTAVGAYVNDVTLQGLKPSTTYSYRVGSPETGYSAVQTFTTGASASEWNFLFYGDPQLGSSGDLRGDAARWRKTVSTSVQAHPDAQMLISAGDQVETGIQSHHDAFKSPAELSQYPVATHMGNHDVMNPAQYYNNYSMPNLDRGNYFYERNNALFIALDTNFTNRLSIQDDIEFIKRTAAEHGQDKDWIIATFHHSPYSQASHNNDPDVALMREQLAPALSDAGVDAVLSGHDHIYTRSHLMEGNTAVPAEAAPGDELTAKDGQTLYVVGNSSSGSKFYDFQTVEPGADQRAGDRWTAVWNQDETPDYTNVSVTADSLRFSTYNVDGGELVDEVTLRH